LRRNWAVQELVEAFTNARPSVLDLAKRATKSGGIAAGIEGADTEEPVTKKRKLEDEVNGTETKSDEGVRTRSQSRGMSRSAQPAAIEIIDDIEDEEYIPGIKHSVSCVWRELTLGLDDGLVPCPICQRRMKNEAVFRHLDSCTGKQGGSTEPKPAAFG
jgi:E3 ubiquitin-protein ligase RAD18